MALERWFYTLHPIAATVHVILFLVLASLASTFVSSGTASVVQLYSSDLPQNGRLARSYEIRESAVVDPRAVMMAICALTALSHIASGMHGNYDDATLWSVTTTRWLEYRVTVPLMRLLIASLCGMRDVYGLVLVSVLSSVTIHFGQIMDDMGMLVDLNAASWVCHVGSWAPIFYEFYDGIARSDRAPPDFVYSLVVVIFLLDFTFAANFIYHARTDRMWRRETVYCILSFISKVSLVGIVIGGFVSP